MHFLEDQTVLNTYIIASNVEWKKYLPQNDYLIIDKIILEKGLDIDNLNFTVTQDYQFHLHKQELLKV